MSLAILANAFIITTSCLNDDATKVLTNPFANFFINLINSFTKKEVKVVPVESIKTNLSSELEYVYNYIPGYKVEEIPLGSAKQIDTNVLPTDATNKSIVYTANPSDSVILNQTGTTLSVVGMKAGQCTITARSSDGGFESSVLVNVIETVAPVSYEISLVESNIAIGTTQTINFDIDGGHLTHNELINFRYFDTRKLTYGSSNEAVATVDNYGVIYPVTVGSSLISVSNGEYTKSIEINVTSGTTPSSYSSLSITGSDVCYGNDMILDQSSNKNHYQLTPKDGDVELDPEDFIWETSNELLARVDKHGVLRGFRKVSVEDETVVISAKSKLTGQTISKVITVKYQLPTKLAFTLTIGEKEIWNPSSSTVVIGDAVTLKLYFTPSGANKDVTIECSNTDIISILKQGDAYRITPLMEGDCSLLVKSVANPELYFETALTVLPAGAISNDDVSNVKTSVRKTVGHASLFMIAQVFTFLTLYMFFYDKKWWFYSVISLGIGLFVSGLTEVIQHFIPGRDGTFIDVLIDFAGVVVGAALTFLGIFIVKKIIAKKEEKRLNKNDESGK